MKSRDQISRGPAFPSGLPSAVKFGWVKYGRGTSAEDAAYVEAARAGMGPNAQVLIDAGQIFAQNVRVAAERIPALARFGALWLEEPSCPMLRQPMARSLKSARKCASPTTVIPHP